MSCCRAVGQPAKLSLLLPEDSLQRFEWLPALSKIAEDRPALIPLVKTGILGLADGCPFECWVLEVGGLAMTAVSPRVSDKGSD